MEENEKFDSHFKKEDISTSEGFWNYMENYWHNNRNFPEDIEDHLDRKADLVDGKVPSSQLPSYVDDILEFDAFENLPVPGEKGKIYLTVNNNAQFRWSGSEYIQINDTADLLTIDTEQSVYGKKWFNTKDGNAHVNHSLRVISHDGSNPGMVFYKSGTNLGTLQYDGSTYFLTNSDISGFGNIKGEGFIKNGSDNNFILTGGGGHISKSDFVTASDLSSYHKKDSSAGLNNASESHTNQTWFDYNWAGSGAAGSVINFSGFWGSYSTELFGSYNDSNKVAIRTRNGDINAWNDPKWLWHDKNFNPDTKINTSDADNKYLPKNVIDNNNFNTIGGYGVSGIYRADNNEGGVKYLYSPMLHMGGRDTMSQLQIEYNNGTSQAGELSYRAGHNNNFTEWRTAWDNVNLPDYRQFGLGKNSATNATDINSVEHTSILDINDGTVNRPFGYGSVWTHRKSPTEFTQLAVDILDGRTYSRGWSNGSGDTGWKRLAEYSELPNMANYTQAWENAISIGFTNGNFDLAPYIYHNTGGHKFLATQKWITDHGLADITQHITSTNGLQDKTGFYEYNGFENPISGIPLNYGNFANLSPYASLITAIYDANALYFRSRSESDLGTWTVKKIWHEGNLNLNDYTTTQFIAQNYALRDGSNATETWANASKGLSNNPAISGKIMNSAGNVYLNAATYGEVAGYINTHGLASGNPTEDWWYRMKFLHNNSAGYYGEIGIQMTGDNSLRYKRFENGMDYGWINVWDNQNFNPLDYVTLNTPQAITHKKTFDKGLAIPGQQKILLKGYDDSAHYITNFTDDTDGFGVSTGFSIKDYTQSQEYFRVDNSSTTSQRTHQVISPDSIRGTLGTAGAYSKLKLGVGSNTTAQYGMNFWVEGSGEGYIQQQRFDGSSSPYALHLQPLGGTLAVREANRVTKDDVIQAYGKISAYGNEQNAVKTWINSGGINTNVAGHEYHFYDHVWRTGNKRGGGANSTAFVFEYSTNQGADYKEKVAIGTDGNIQTSNYGNSKQWNTAYLRGDFRDYGLGKTNSIDVSDLNNLPNTGIYGLQPTTLNSPHGYGNVINMRYGNSEYTQMAVGTTNGILYTRGVYNTGDSGWKRNWNSGDFDPGTFATKSWVESQAYTTQTFVEDSLNQMMAEHVDPDYPISVRNNFNTIIVTDQSPAQYVKLENELFPGKSLTITNVASFDIEVHKNGSVIDVVRSLETNEYHITQQKKLVKKGFYKDAKIIA